MSGKRPAVPNHIKFGKGVSASTFQNARIPPPPSRISPRFVQNANMSQAQNRANVKQQPNVIQLPVDQIKMQPPSPVAVIRPQVVLRPRAPQITAYRPPAKQPARIIVNRPPVQIAARRPPVPIAPMRREPVQRQMENLPTESNNEAMDASKAKIQSAAIDIPSDFEHIFHAPSQLVLFEEQSEAKMLQQPNEETGVDETGSAYANQLLEQHGATSLSQYFPENEQANVQNAQVMSPGVRAEVNRNRLQQMLNKSQDPRARNP